MIFLKSIWDFNCDLNMKSLRNILKKLKLRKLTSFKIDLNFFHFVNYLESTSINFKLA